MCACVRFCVCVGVCSELGSRRPTEKRQTKSDPFSTRAEKTLQVQKETFCVHLALGIILSALSPVFTDPVPTKHSAH